MRENEAAAHALAGDLSAAGIDARVAGGGVQWQVDVRSATSRSLVVHCFWYDRHIAGLLLGMNPANARSRLGSTPALAAVGAEYLTILRDDSARVADGRTRDPADVVRCAHAWLAGVDLQGLVGVAPFIDTKRREMRAVAERLDAGLRWEIMGDPAYELWVYGSDRSCKFVGVDGRVTCIFLLGQAQVGHAAALDDAPAAAAAWLLPGVSVRHLVTLVPGVEIERHADVLEVDPARWHWLHLRDRVCEPTDVLSPLRALTDALATSPVARRFFTYSSLNRLCFSASSHYPWVDQGLPVVTPTGDGAYVVGSTRCDLLHAVKSVEVVLAACATRPFFGCAQHHELPLLAECLARQGSTLRPQLVQRGAWYELLVAEGSRRCEVRDRHVAFTEGGRRLDAVYRSREAGAAAIRCYLEGATSFGEVAADPLAQVIGAREG
jgi:hypothetical protein